MRTPSVVIVGGGPGGVTTAIALAAHAIPALILERTEGPRARPGECLSSGFAPLLARLGLSGLLASPAHRPFTGIVSAWDHPEPAERDVPLDGAGEGEGWLLDRVTFEAQLARAARARGVISRRGHRVTAVDRAEGGPWRITAEGQDGSLEVEADFIVDATGRAASVARMLGVRRERRDGLVGSWALFDAPGPRPVPRESPIHIEATRSGWWYVARLADGRFSVVLFADRAVLDPGAFQRELREARHASALLGGTTYHLSKAPTAHPAHSSRLEAPCGPGWFAVGDAACSFDPLSSYGIGSALGTGFYAAQAIASAWAGEAASYDAYRYLVESRYDHYLDMLCERYQSVARFPDAPFWARRR